MKITYGEDVIV